MLLLIILFGTIFSRQHPCLGKPAFCFTVICFFRTAEMRSCAHTHTQSCTHTILHSHNPAHTQSCTHTILHSHNPAHTQSCTHTILHSHNPAHTQSCTHTILHTHNPAHTQSCTHTHTILHSHNPAHHISSYIAENSFLYFILYSCTVSVRLFN